MMPRLLMMEGNTLARQKKAAALGVRSASGVYSEAIRAHFPNIQIDVVHAADRNQYLPPGMLLKDYDGLVVGGSGLHAYDQTYEVTNQIELLRDYAKIGGPILGSCWGLQIAAIAAGGAVGLSPNGREFGFARKITLSTKGRRHRFFGGKAESFDAPCIHYDEVTTLPSGATLLCSNNHSEIQGAIIPLEKSEVWAVQYHPEFDLEQISMMINLYAEDMLKQGFFDCEQDRASFTRKIDGLIENPAAKSLAWQLGIDSDILDTNVRRAEIINWIDHCILCKN